MTEERYQLLSSEYEKLENILNKLLAENDKIADSFSTSNGKILTDSVEESIHFIKKLVEDHKNHYLTGYDNTDDDLFSFLSNEDGKQ